MSCHDSDRYDLDDYETYDGYLGDDEPEPAWEPDLDWYRSQLRLLDVLPLDVAARLACLHVDMYQARLDECAALQARLDAHHARHGRGRQQGRAAA